jgi:hypothetical protein
MRVQITLLNVLITLVSVKITLVCVKITLCVLESHSEYENHTRPCFCFLGGQTPIDPRLRLQAEILFFP